MLNNTNICSILCNTQLSANSLVRVLSVLPSNACFFCMYHQLLTTSEDVMKILVVSIIIKTKQHTLGL